MPTHTLHQPVQRLRLHRRQHADRVLALILLHRQGVMHLARITGGRCIALRQLKEVAGLDKPPQLLLVMRLPMLLAPVLTALEEIGRHYPDGPIARMFKDQRWQMEYGDGRRTLAKEDTLYDIIEADAILPQGSRTTNQSLACCSTR